MPLTPINYTQQYGEWYPWDGTNYTGYPTALKFFHSLRAKTEIGVNVAVGTIVNGTVPDDSSGYNGGDLANIWPTDISGNVTTYSDGSTIYKTRFRTDGLQLDIEKPSNLEEAADPDTILYQAYLQSALDLFDRNKTEYLDWGTVEYCDGEAPNNLRDLSENRTEIISTFEPVPENVTINENNSRYRLRFPWLTLIDQIVVNDTVVGEIPVTCPRFIEGAYIEWYPSAVGGGNFNPDPADYLITSNDGNEIAPPGSYIKLERSPGQPSESQSNNDGRIFQLGDSSISGDNLTRYTQVFSTDGLPLTTETTTINYNFQNVSMRPKLKIRYRIPADTEDDVPGGGGGGSALQIYTFYSAENSSLAWGYSDFSNSGTLNTDDTNWIGDSSQDPDSHILRSSNTDDTAIITGLGGMRQQNWGNWQDQGDGPNATGFNAIQLNTNFVDPGASEDREKRITPWRKAYRFLNRFTFNGAELSLWWDDASQPGVVTGKAYFEMKYNHVFGRTPIGDRGLEFPPACIHRPPCFYAGDPDTQGQLGSNSITLGHSITKSELLEGSWWGLNHDYDGDGSNDPSWNKWNANYWADPSGSGYQLIEKNRPDTMYFTANLDDSGSRQGLPDYNFSGSVSCTDIVVPAYSGETLFKDYNNSSQGFVVNNYVTQSGTPVDAILIDISETDEVLRMTNQGGYTRQFAADKWRSTITRIRVNNITKALNKSFGSSAVPFSYEIVTQDVNGVDLDPKKNFVVAVIADESTNWLSTWQTGDRIEISLLGKKVLRDYLVEDLDISTATYDPIQYRPLEDEAKDDVEKEFIPVSGEVGNFTITGDGEVDGNITIVLDGDVPSNVRFDIVEYEEEE